MGYVQAEQLRMIIHPAARKETYQIGTVSNTFLIHDTHKNLPPKPKLTDPSKIHITSPRHPPNDSR